MTLTQLVLSICAFVIVLVFASALWIAAVLAPRDDKPVQGEPL